MREILFPKFSKIREQKERILKLISLPNNEVTYIFNNLIVFELTHLAWSLSQPSAPG